MSKILEKYQILLKPWGEVVEAINQDAVILDKAFLEVKQYFDSDNIRITKDTLDLILALLEHNNIIFYKNANYSHYQEVSKYLFKHLPHLEMDDFQRNRFFVTAVYSDYFMSDSKLKEWFEKELLKSCQYFQENPKDNYDFLSLIHVSQFYLFIGQLKRSIDYLNKAQSLFDKCHCYNYKLFYLYHYAWSAYEDANYMVAISRVNKAIDMLLNKQTPIALHLLNIKATMMYKVCNYESSLSLAEVVYEKSKDFFGKTNQDVVAESLLTIARNLIMLRQYQEALKKTKEVIKLLEKLFGGSAIDPSQAVAMSVCADAYMELNQKFEGALYYNKAFNIYKYLYGDNISSMPEVKLLESKLKICI